MVNKNMSKNPHIILKLFFFKSAPWSYDKSFCPKRSIVRPSYERELAEENDQSFCSKMTCCSNSSPSPSRLRGLTQLNVVRPARISLFRPLFPALLEGFCSSFDFQEIHGLKSLKLQKTRAFLSKNLSKIRFRHI